jgi:hypothetical protein
MIFYTSPRTAQENAPKGGAATKATPVARHRRRKETQDTETQDERPKDERRKGGGRRLQKVTVTKPRSFSNVLAQGGVKNEHEKGSREEAARKFAPKRHTLPLTRSLYRYFPA